MLPSGYLGSIPTVIQNFEFTWTQHISSLFVPCGLLLLTLDNKLDFIRHCQYFSTQHSPQSFTPLARKNWFSLLLVSSGFMMNMNHSRSSNFSFSASSASGPGRTSRWSSQWCCSPSYPSGCYSYQSKKQKILTTISGKWAKSTKLFYLFCDSVAKFS